MKTTLLFTDDARLKNRPVSKKEIDEKALHALVQSAVNVELFTIPLYMTSLYSLKGMHQINSEDSNFYEGRTWPGMAASANPQSANENAFNAVFSVFVAEMLHLQIISNIANVVGYEPKFTCEPLQNEKTFAWNCYSPNSSVLPGILDFKDTVKNKNVKVKLGPMDADQCTLFLAIEQTEKAAMEDFEPDREYIYKEVAPYDNWQEGQPLPQFGSIGNMYEQLWNYLSIQYADGVTLWEIVFKKGLAKAKEKSTKSGSNQLVKTALQREVFNPGRLDPDYDKKQPDEWPNDEYPYMPTSIEHTEYEKGLADVLKMIDGITDQGEGGGVVAGILARVSKARMLQTPLTLTVVQNQYRPSCPVLRNKYPSYNATGGKEDSAKAEARVHFGGMDHFETFQYVQTLIESGDIETWDQWHAKGKKWTADLLKTTAYNPDLYPNLPKAEEIADALNNLKLNDPDGKNYELFSRASTGAIAGVTRVLNDYFQNPGTSFPYPSMGGSGDRMSICWAIFGKIPNIALGITPDDAPPIDRKNHLYHACQGLNLDESFKEDPASCAQVGMFHTCKGSNECKGEGGCGFVHSAGTSGSGCGGSTSKNPPPFSPPSDNACGALGGCAVPISASQMYPDLPKDTAYDMQLFDFGPAPAYKPEALGTFKYAKGDLIYDVAWTAYTEVLKKRGVKIPDKPKPSDIRVALPPST